ncbi:uncharacterized protein [Rutidosis leptorrhynchoides]|uniref:uncharacterized protein n=1 Tax=Rutidosis leptorrhynchoides TaxID=125765 RepID=UPI003A99543F
MLKGDVRVWFDSLPKDSVASFDDLKRQFKSKFSQHERHKKNHVAAHGIKQKDNESSRAFLNSRDLPNTYEVLLEKAYVWLGAKETAGIFVLDDASANRRREKSERRDDKHGRKEDKGRFHPYQRDTGARILGALIKTPKEILTTEKAAHKFKALGKMSNWGKQRDMTEFCDFHNDFGHETDECFNFKTAIEEAVKSGKLSHLIKGIREPKKEMVQEQKIEDKRQETENEILAIDSHQPYKKRERVRIVREWKEVSFSALDTICPSDLPVTISGKIFNREVRRIYLDSGSDCDVMYEHCFDRLCPAIRARLGAPRVPLIGFFGERCWPIGEIDLDFTIGKPPLTRTEIIDFVVVRASSPHNILLGRVAMRKMGIIVSTVHHMVKFHTHEGSGTLASTYDRDNVILAIKETKKEPTECILETFEENPQVGKDIGQPNVSRPRDQFRTQPTGIHQAKALEVVTS